MSSTNTKTASNNEKEDLDTFLTTIESKLRGPFSSLDLAKAVTTTALRGSLTPAEYLESISQVLSRTDKVIQLRMLIGLLGLDPSEETNPEIYKIVSQAQEAPKHEEWVRTIAGLIQGIMFQEESGERSRGEEAKILLQTTCEEICKRVEDLISSSEDETHNCPDLNASFVPYRYSLISQRLLKPIIPECCGANPHFKVNEETSILHLDEKLEAQRAKEEKEHQTPILNTSKNSSSTNKATSNNAPTNFPPGFRPTKLVTAKDKSSIAKPKTNMFMPKKPNPLVAQRQKNQSQQKGQVLRSKGAAQSLVNKLSMKNRSATVGGGGASSSTAQAKGGRAMAARSKMKMIDVQEVDSLNKEHAKREQDTANSRLSKKRRILESAMQRGLVHKKTKTREEAPAPAPKKTKTEEAAPAQSAESPKPQEPPAQPEAVPALEQPPQLQSSITSSATPALNAAEEWKVLLEERSNKLSKDDRMRVQQFFERRSNPTPDQPVYKMKLHEQRTNDLESGQAIKETFYLELDYNSFTSKQSKKVKRY
jgi:hypothetical protein